MLLLNISFPHSPSIRPPSWMSSESRDCVTRRGRSYPFYSQGPCLKRNLDNFQNHLLHELSFSLTIIGLSETRITNADSNSLTFNPNIPGYNFEYVPAPLSAGGVGMYIKEELNYRIVERTSNESFQALWVELQFPKKTNVICGILYRQHNSPASFQYYFESSLNKYSASGKTDIYIGRLQHKSSQI